MKIKNIFTTKSMYKKITSLLILVAIVVGVYDSKIENAEAVKLAYTTATTGTSWVVPTGVTSIVVLSLIHI